MTQSPNVTPLTQTNSAVRRIFVRDLKLDAHIGAFAEEKGRTQPIIINLDLSVMDTPHGDQLANVVCYKEIVDRIKDLIAEGHLALVESFAERIAATCLADPRALSVKVRIEKPDAIAEAAGSGIEIERTRPAG